MVELSVISRKNSTRNLTIYDKNENLKVEARERKKNLLYLIQKYLIEQKLCLAAEALQNEAQLNDEYQACENIDLDIILQEYQSYYHTKFQKYPKILRKTERINSIKIQRKQSGKIQKEDIGKIKESTTHESEDFQFEIISLSSSKTETVETSGIFKKPPFNFDGYSSEWKDFAEQIMKECIPKYLNVNVKWNDCIGLDNAKEKLKEATIYPIMYDDVFKDVQVWKGILLFGPPGTGKTLLAKAVSTEGLTFMNVASSTIISKWRGESEKMIKVLFELARYYAPTTIFIDEIDGLVSGSEQSYHDASRRLKSELLTQIDGLNSTENIFILGSTNEPWNLDAALLRRFEKRILVPLPDGNDRINLLKHYLPKPANINQKEFEQLALQTEKYSGSDIKTLCKEVLMNLVRQKIKDIKLNGNNKSRAIARNITYREVEIAIGKNKPCNSDYDIKKYLDWNEKYGSW